MRELRLYKIALFFSQESYFLFNEISVFYIPATALTINTHTIKNIDDSIQ
jgi:hypothetical protein